MLRAPLYRNVALGLARARTASCLRTFQAPSQILLQQQRARIHQQAPDQPLPQPKSKEARKNPQSTRKQSESQKTPSKQPKDANGTACNTTSDDQDDLRFALWVTIISDMIHDLTHHFDDDE